MALTGLDIYKLLPKTNCKECGFPTCLAFGMKLAAKQATLSACPYVSEEAKVTLEAASAPPIRLVTIGAGEGKLEVGNELVLFRHEKTFYHQPGLFVRLSDTADKETAVAIAEKVQAYFVERVGERLSLDGLALENSSGDAAAFARLAELAMAKTTKPLVLISDSAASLGAALNVCASRRPLLCGANAANWAEVASLAKAHSCPVVVRGDGTLDSLVAMVGHLTSAGVADLILDAAASDMPGSLEAETAIRRLAIKRSFRPLGYPTIEFCLNEGLGDILFSLDCATQAICKYAGIVVIDTVDGGMLYPLLTLRQNIYTDPQKPIQVKPDVYPVRDPGPTSPVLITTNFSLTYFTVSGEIEASGIPSWLVIADAEGMSVLTAWAAGKFDGEKIGKTIKSLGLEEKVGHRQLIIPGLVSQLSGEIEEELPGWKVIVGPREAVDLPRFLKNWRA